MDMMNSLDYYRKSVKITNINKYKEFISWLSNDIRVIFQTVQGLLIHGSWLKFYGVSTNGHEELYNVYIEEILDKALELDDNSFAISRSLDKRIIVSCREYATLFCAILRAKGVPARCRCGFSKYLAQEGYYEDHWILSIGEEINGLRLIHKLIPFNKVV